MLELFHKLNAVDMKIWLMEDNQDSKAYGIFDWEEVFTEKNLILDAIYAAGYTDDAIEDMCNAANK